ncbi:hypothetical protein VCHA53O466_50005 [Vibrio chagasii]|nr:hypothetical protein VCHA53O466_50005 [Vibrio chagasii]
MTKLLKLTDSQLTTLEFAVSNLSDTMAYSDDQLTKDNLAELNKILTSARKEKRAVLKLDIADVEQDALDTNTHTVTIELDGNHVWTSLTPINKEPVEADGLHSLIEVRGGLPATSVGISQHENIIHLLSDQDSQLAVIPEFDCPSTRTWGKVEFSSNDHNGLVFK